MSSKVFQKFSLLDNNIIIMSNKISLAGQCLAKYLSALPDMSSKYRVSSIILILWVILYYVSNVVPLQRPVSASPWLRTRSVLSPRSPPPPNLPPGPAHKLAFNYYGSRDLRRSVAPPTSVSTQKQISQSSEEVTRFVEENISACNGWFGSIYIVSITFSWFPLQWRSGVSSAVDPAHSWLRTPMDTKTRLIELQ